MGNKCSCNDCPVTGSEGSHSMTVSFLSFEWNSWHAQSLGVGGIIGISLLLFLICTCGTRILDCLVPVHCRSWTSRPGMGSSHLSRGHSLRRPRCVEPHAPHASYSIPLQPQQNNPHAPNASYCPSPPSAPCQNQWDREGMRQLMVQHSSL